MNDIEEVTVMAPLDKTAEAEAHGPTDSAEDERHGQPPTEPACLDTSVEDSCRDATLLDRENKLETPKKSTQEMTETEALTTALRAVGASLEPTVVALLRRNPQGLRSDEIAKSLGVDGRDLGLVLRDAVAGQQIKKNGTKHATYTALK